MATFSCFCIMLTISLGVAQGDYAYDYDDAFAPGKSEAPVPAQAPMPPNGRSALVPALFAFGDSLIDSGNNNQLFSLAKANYLPYGIDFGGPTGRFSNAYTILDKIGNSFHFSSLFFFGSFLIVDVGVCFLKLLLSVI